MLTLDIQRESEDPSPADDALIAAVQAALAVAGDPTSDVEMSLRIVDREEMRALNHSYRDRDRPTNVLSFPADLPPGLPFRHLGDVVVCAGVVAEEARQQQKTEDAHWAHMLVHGTLHLLGHDHENDRDAEDMEALETLALARLNWPCPYRDDRAGSTMEALG
jgi:probable rRNA maturation factor